MEDLSEHNPYPEDEPRLHRAWEDGYWTAKSGQPMAEVPGFFDPIIRAFREGQKVALTQNALD